MTLGHRTGACRPQFHPHLADSLGGLLDDKASWLYILEENFGLTGQTGARDVRLVVINVVALTCLGGALPFIVLDDLLERGVPVVGGRSGGGGGGSGGIHCVIGDLRRRSCGGRDEWS